VVGGPVDPPVVGGPVDPPVVVAPAVVVGAVVAIVVALDAEGPLDGGSGPPSQAAIDHETTAAMAAAHRTVRRGTTFPRIRTAPVLPARRRPIGERPRHPGARLGA
jgi:hypothetical protein